MLLAVNLHADRALAGDDIGVVEGRDHGHAFLDHQTFGFHPGLILGLADDPNISAQSPDRLDLIARHQTRHADRAVGTGQPRR